VFLKVQCTDKSEMRLPCMVPVLVLTPHAICRILAVSPEETPAKAVTSARARRQQCAQLETLRRLS
jgi:hypothetical protein